MSDPNPEYGMDNELDIREQMERTEEGPVCTGDECEVEKE